MGRSPHDNYKYTWHYNLLGFETDILYDLITIHIAVSRNIYVIFKMIPLADATKRPHKRMESSTVPKQQAMQACRARRDN